MSLWNVLDDEPVPEWNWTIGSQPRHEPTFQDAPVVINPIAYRSINTADRLDRITADQAMPNGLTWNS
jgi:hypothetical protein